jgi:hypothetical protein
MDSIDPLISQLRAQGLLLQQDALLPNVVAAVAGKPVRGSWWGHPQGHAIYNTLNALAQHPDVLVTRLVHGKVTFVHRRLWGAVLAVGQSQAAWQFARLSAPAVALLELVRRQGMLFASGKSVKALELRLLAHGEQVHTDAGHHAIRLESWTAWAARVGCQSSLSPSAGQQALEAALEALGGTATLLPWPLRTPDTQTARRHSGSG